MERCTEVTINPELFGNHPEHVAMMMSREKEAWHEICNDRYTQQVDKCIICICVPSKWHNLTHSPQEHLGTLCWLLQYAVPKQSAPNWSYHGTKQILQHVRHGRISWCLFVLLLGTLAVHHQRQREPERQGVGECGPYDSHTHIFI